MATPIIAQRTRTIKRESVCEGCGKPATRLAKGGARNGVELAKMPKLGECCLERLRPAGLDALTFLGGLS